MCISGGYAQHDQKFRCTCVILLSYQVMLTQMKWMYIILLISIFPVMVEKEVSHYNAGSISCKNFQWQIKYTSQQIQQYLKNKEKRKEFSTPVNKKFEVLQYLTVATINGHWDKLQETCMWWNLRKENIRGHKEWITAGSWGKSRTKRTTETKNQPVSGYSAIWFIYLIKHSDYLLIN
jgi:hypothetical protein